MSQEFVDGFIGRMRSQLAPVLTDADGFRKRCPLVEIDGHQYRLLSQEKMDDKGRPLSFTLWKIPNTVFEYCIDQESHDEDELMKTLAIVNANGGYNGTDTLGYICVLPGTSETKRIVLSTPEDLNQHLGWVTEVMNRCIERIEMKDNTFEFEFSFDIEGPSQTFDKLFPRGNAVWKEDKTESFNKYDIFTFEVIGEWGFSTGRVTLLKTFEK